MSQVMRSSCLLWTVGLVATGFAGRSVANGSNECTATVIVVVGAAGETGYCTNFLRQAGAWRQTCERGGAAFVWIGPGSQGGSGTNDASGAAIATEAVKDSGESSDETPVPLDRELLRDTLSRESPDGTVPLWLVLIGHGTFDGKEARFNLRGPDLSPADLSEWLGPIQRPLVLVNTAAASAPFLNELSRSNRVIISATRSGNEVSFAHFGEFLAQALGDAQSDLDKDDQISLLESFLTASARVREFYRMEGRMTSEHALIDDNGDGRGTPAEWYRGVRAVKQAQEAAPVDGARAHQLHLVLSPAEQVLPELTRARRDALELEVFELRSRKAGFGEDEYFERLERLLLELARLYAPATDTETSQTSESDGTR